MYPTYTMDRGVERNWNNEKLINNNLQTRTVGVSTCGGVFKEKNVCFFFRSACKEPVLFKR